MTSQYSKAETVAGLLGFGIVGVVVALSFRKAAAQKPRTKPRLISSIYV